MDIGSRMRRGLEYAAGAYKEWVGEKHWDLERKLLVRTHDKDHLVKQDLVDIVDWKTNGRAVHLAEDVANTEDLVKDMTAMAFTTGDVVRAIEILAEGDGNRRLYGVRYPVASSILMFHDPGRFTVYDPNALEALQALRPKGLRPNKKDRKGKESFEVCDGGSYEEYLCACWDLATDLGMGLRDLDRALWMLGASGWVIGLLKAMEERP